MEYGFEIPENIDELKWKDAYYDNPETPGYYLTLRERTLKIRQKHRHLNPYYKIVEFYVYGKHGGYTTGRWGETGVLYWMPLPIQPNNVKIHHRYNRL